MATTTVETYDDQGHLLDSKQVPIADETVNAQVLRDRASQALAANDTFLGLANPTNAQILAQVQRLTKESSALIRLLLGQLDTTAGT